LKDFKNKKYHLTILKKLLSTLGSFKFIIYITLNSSLAILDILALKILASTLNLGAESLSGSVSIGVSKYEFLNVIILLLVKNILAATLNFYMLRDLATAETIIAIQNYEKLENDKNTMVKNLTLSSLINQFEKIPFTYSQVYFNYIIIGSELINIIAILIVIILILPKIVFLAFPIILILLLLQQIILSNKIEEDGRLVNSEYLKTLNLIEDKNNLTELIQLSQSTSFFKEFSETRLELSAARAKSIFWSIIPRFTLEALVIIIAGIFGILTYYFVGIASVIPVLAIIMTAAFRVTPSLNRIQTSFLQIRNYMPIISHLENEMKSTDNASESNVNFWITNNGEKTVGDNLIVLNSVNYKRGKPSKNILNNVSLEIKKNKSYIITGESGSGKTSLIKILSGLETPSSGEIWKQKVKIGYVPQTFHRIQHANLIQNVALEWGSEVDIDLDKIARSLISCNLMNPTTPLEEFNKSVDIAKLSGGEGQRLSIARALYKECELLIMDEPTSSLDRRNEEDIFNLINQIKLNRTVVVVSHKNDYINNFDYVLNISENGEVELKRI
jgi:ABC-type bacteriocin/lantibiotic exporter with double-glycine peptidase domain